MRAVAGKLADAESVAALKDLFNRVGAGDTRAEGVEGVGADCAPPTPRSNLVGVEDGPRASRGLGPAFGGPVLNVRLRRTNARPGHRASVGPHGDLTARWVSGRRRRDRRSPPGSTLPRAPGRRRAPLIIVGASLLRPPPRRAHETPARAVRRGVVKGDWSGFNVLRPGGAVKRSTSGSCPPRAPPLRMQRRRWCSLAQRRSTRRRRRSWCTSITAALGFGGANVVPGGVRGGHLRQLPRPRAAPPAVLTQQAQEDWKMRALSEVCGAALPTMTSRACWRDWRRMRRRAVAASTGALAQRRDVRARLQAGRGGGRRRRSRRPSRLHDGCHLARPRRWPRRQGESRRGVVVVVVVLNEPGSNGGHLVFDSVFPVGRGGHGADRHTPPVTAGL